MRNGSSRGQWITAAAGIPVPAIAAPAQIQRIRRVVSRCGSCSGSPGNGWSSAGSPHADGSPLRQGLIGRWLRAPCAWGAP